MLPLALTSAAVLFANFATGYGTYTANASGMAALSRDEERYVERVMPQLRACPDKGCRDRAALTIAEIINLRRAMHDKFVGNTVFDALRAPCEVLDNDIRAQRDCFERRMPATFEQGMTLAGFRRAGVTRAGYSQLRTGLQMREVEFILGGPGDEVTYASRGGYSAAMYRWRRGRAMILVSFANDESSGRSQRGL